MTPQLQSFDNITQALNTLILAYNADMSQWTNRGLILGIAIVVVAALVLSDIKDEIRFGQLGATADGRERLGKRRTRVLFGSVLAVCLIAGAVTWNESKYRDEYITQFKPAVTLAQTVVAHATNTEIDKVRVNDYEDAVELIGRAISILTQTLRNIAPAVIESTLTQSKIESPVRAMAQLNTLIEEVLAEKRSMIRTAAVVTLVLLLVFFLVFLVLRARKKLGAHKIMQELVLVVGGVSLIVVVSAMTPVGAEYDWAHFRHKATEQDRIMMIALKQQASQVHGIKDPDFYDLQNVLASNLTHLGALRISEASPDVLTPTNVISAYDAMLISGIEKWQKTQSTEDQGS